jgi:hypothetical protein
MVPRSECSLLAPRSESEKGERKGSEKVSGTDFSTARG